MWSWTSMCWSLTLSFTSSSNRNFTVVSVLINSRISIGSLYLFCLFTGIYLMRYYHHKFLSFFRHSFLYFCKHIYNRCFEVFDACLKICVQSEIAPIVCMFFQSMAHVFLLFCPFSLNSGYFIYLAILDLDFLHFFSSKSYCWCFFHLLFKVAFLDLICSIFLPCSLWSLIFMLSFYSTSFFEIFHLISFYFICLTSYQ